jgi:hypothetical protein
VAGALFTVARPLVVAVWGFPPSGRSGLTRR